MFAIIRTGGKQYKVAKDTKITVEKLEAAAGESVKLDVLMLADGDKLKMGDQLSNVSVTAEVVEQTRNEKVIIFKKRRRQNSRRKNGHRQHVTVLKIKDIKVA